jgi:hypothetical protein
MEWKKELKQKHAAILEADTRLKSHKDSFMELVVKATNDSDVRIDSVASATGWSVSYLRALRVKHVASMPRKKSTTAKPISSAAAAQLKASRKSVEAAEKAYEESRTTMIQLIDSIVTPAPTMSDVAEVLGVSRQRVSQLLDEL